MNRSAAIELDFIPTLIPLPPDIRMSYQPGPTDATLRDTLIAHIKELDPSKVEGMDLRKFVTSFLRFRYKNQDHLFERCIKIMLTLDQELLPYHVSVFKNRFGVHIPKHIIIEQLPDVNLEDIRAIWDLCYNKFQTCGVFMDYVQVILNNYVKWHLYPNRNQLVIAAVVVLMQYHKI